MNKSRDFSLDMLRALACIMVMGVHLQQHIGMPGAIGSFFEKGSTGVGFFFILSGYLAYFSLDRLFGKSGDFSKNVVAYWIKRALHILPLYYLAIMFYFIFYTVNKSVPKDETGLYWLRYIFLINKWVPSDVEFWANLGAVWSISVFVLFYLIAPFYYKLVKNFYTAVIGVILSFGILKFFDKIGNNDIPIKHMFYFCLGIMVYLAIKENHELVSIAVIGLILIFCILADKGTMLSAPLLACMYIFATRGKEIRISRDNVVYKAVSGISMISYSLYLDHAIVINVLDFYGVTNKIFYLIVFVGASIILSIITYYLVEKRLVDFIQGRMK